MMRCALRWFTSSAGYYAIFGIPATCVALVVFIAMAAGNINTADVAHYLRHSRAVFDGVLTADSPFDYAGYRPPFFSAVIATAGIISDTYQVHITLVGNLVVSLIALWLVFISRRTALETSGRVALVIFLFANVWFFREMITLRETAWYTLFCIVFVLVWQKLYASPILGVSLGAITGLAILTRPSGIIFAIAAMIILTILWLTRTISATRFAMASSSFIVVVALVLSPWQIYLYKNFGRMELTSSCTGGLNLFKGNHPFMGDLEPSIDLDAADPYIENYADSHIRGPLEPASVCVRSEFLGAEFRAYVRQDPVRFLKSLTASLVYFFAPSPMPLSAGGASFDSTGHQLKVDSFHPRKITSFVSVFYYAGLYVAALAGLYLTRRRRDELLWAGPVVLLVLGHAAVYAATLTESRFRMPLEPLLCVLAAIAIQRLIRSRSEDTDRN